MFTSAEQSPLHAEPEVEDSRVAQWRFDQFRSLGFESEQAFHLTVSGTDLHAARTLIEMGCSLPLALRILL